MRKIHIMLQSSVGSGVGCCVGGGVGGRQGQWGAMGRRLFQTYRTTILPSLATRMDTTGVVLKPSVSMET